MAHAGLRLLPGLRGLSRLHESLRGDVRGVGLPDGGAEHPRDGHGEGGGGTTNGDEWAVFLNASLQVAFFYHTAGGDPSGNDPYYTPIYGSPTWERLNDEERRMVRHHMTAWLNAQFLHGEQGALVCTAKIVMSVPDVDAKF